MCTFLLIDIFQSGVDATQAFTATFGVELRGWWRVGLIGRGITTGESETKTIPGRGMGEGEPKEEDDKSLVTKKTRLLVITASRLAAANANSCG